MTLAKVCRLFSFTTLAIMMSFGGPIAGQLLEPTPDPYFKPPVKKPDFSESYVPPTFSPGSIGARKLPKSTAAVPWSHQRSIVRDRSNDLFETPSKIVDTPDKIQLVAAAEPIAKQLQQPPFEQPSQFQQPPQIQQPPQFHAQDARVATLPPDAVVTSPNITSTQTQFEPSRVVAIVGGEPVFVGDMLYDANQIIESKIPQAPEEAKQIQRKRLLTALTKKYVDKKMLYVDAVSRIPEEANIDDIVSRASSIFNEQILPRILERTGVSSATEFDGNLRILGSSLRQYRTAWARDQVARQFTQESLDIDENVTHQEMLEDYLANKEQYANRARVRWEQIMIRFDKHDSRTEAKKKIAELGNQIIYGASFAEIAKKHSHGFRASKGGRHDWTGKNALVLKKVDQAIFTLPVFELSDIIESRDGYHIIRVIEREDASYTPFTEAQIKIRDRLRDAKINEAFESHIEQLRANMPIEYFPLE